jgi:hypothetical protein
MIKRSAIKKRKEDAKGMLIHRFTDWRGIHRKIFTTNINLPQKINGDKSSQWWKKMTASRLTHRSTYIAVPLTAEKSHRKDFLQKQTYMYKYKFWKISWKIHVGTYNSCLNYLFLDQLATNFDQTCTFFLLYCFLLRDQIFFLRITAARICISLTSFDGAGIGKKLVIYL